MCSNKKKLIPLLALGALALGVWACATQEKLAAIKRGEVSTSFRLPIDTTFVPQIKRASVARDTITVRGEKGEELIVMKAYKADDGGLMVTEQLEAAFVTAKSRNVAVRNGQVNLAFQIVVPQGIRDEMWQLRFYPLVKIGEDTLTLQPILITGEEYRRKQLRGYERYNRFLKGIIPDSTVNVDLKNLEIFLKRNIPQLYALKADSTVVSDSVYRTIYGVTQREAVEHYTRRHIITDKERKRNQELMARRNEVFRRRVRVPMLSEGIKLDTVVMDDNGDFIYNYTQVLQTRPGLRRADVTLTGDIYEQDRLLYAMPESAPITFYISSLSAFTEPIIRYKKKVVERRVGANASYNIEFEMGYADVRENLADNARELALIRTNLGALMANKEFDLDSVVVEAHASPEGRFDANMRLSRKRSAAMADYFEADIRRMRDSLKKNVSAFQVNEKGSIVHTKASEVRMSSRWSGENWAGLDRLIDKDSFLSEEQKEGYRALSRIRDLDEREQALSRKDYYHYVSDSLYPRLRTVDFNFYMHRKGMVKDTIHTTVLDSTYMEGVKALQDMDYNKALLLLAPYQDFNTAVAYSAMDRDRSALNILEKEKDRGSVNYLLALTYWRLGNEQKAVEHYLKACRQDHSYVYRGNLDPEISVMVALYGLNKDDEDENLENYE